MPRAKVIIDTREQNPLPLSQIDPRLELERRALKTGDYGRADGRTLVEVKRWADLVHCTIMRANHDRMLAQLDRLRKVPNGLLLLQFDPRVPVRLPRARRPFPVAPALLARVGQFVTELLDTGVRALTFETDYIGARLCLNWLLNDHLDSSVSLTGY